METLRPKWLLQGEAWTLMQAVWPRGLRSNYHPVLLFFPDPGETSNRRSALGSLLASCGQHLQTVPGPCPVPPGPALAPRGSPGKKAPTASWRILCAVTEPTPHLASAAHGGLVSFPRP